MTLKNNLVSGIAVGLAALMLGGCGAGSADIPASVPHPRKMSDAPGGSLNDIAKSKGMGMPSQPSGKNSQFNPTNP